MIRETAISGGARLSDEIRGRRNEMVIASISAGNTNGRLWRIESGSEVAAILWDQGNNVFVLAGEIGGVGREAVRKHIDSRIRPEARRIGKVVFSACALVEGMAPFLPDLFPGIDLSKTGKRLYEFESSAIDLRSFLPPEGVRLVPIDAELLDKVTAGSAGDMTPAGEWQAACPESIEPIREEVRWMWPSETRFRDEGFGFAALVDNRAIGWCTAEYVSRRMCGIGIEVVLEYRGRGVGTAMAAHFIVESASRGILPHWECGTSNTASIRLAERLGFHLVEETTVSIGRF